MVMSGGYCLLMKFVLAVVIGQVNMFAGFTGIELIIGEMLMGREIRKVTPNYEHPKDGYGDYIPLYDNFNDVDESLEKYARYRCPDNFMLPDTNDVIDICESCPAKM